MAALGLLAMLLAACGPTEDPAPDTAEKDGATTDIDADTPDDAPADTPEDGAPELKEDQDGDWPYEYLSTYEFFRGPLRNHVPHDGVVPYDVIAPLFSDGTGKLRFIVLPDNKPIAFDPEERWVYPNRTLIIKTFYFNHDDRDPQQGRDILETRLLIKHNDEWVGHVYLWDEDEGDAVRRKSVKRVDTSRLDKNGETVELRYIVPDPNKCENCHTQFDQMVPLGPRARQLNRGFDYGAGEVNQLAHFESLGMFDRTLPALDSLFTLTAPDDERTTLETRSRMYFEANCSHCHGTGAAASSSGLHLGIEETDEIALGICRKPTATGQASGDLLYDIVPGNPDQSIIVQRMESLDPEIKMPELPTVTSDAEGVALIRAWIAAMPERECR